MVLKRTRNGVVTIFCTLIKFLQPLQHEMAARNFLFISSGFFGEIKSNDSFTGCNFIFWWIIFYAWTSFLRAYLDSVVF